MFNRSVKNVDCFTQITEIVNVVIYRITSVISFLITNKFCLRRKGVNIVYSRSWLESKII